MLSGSLSMADVSPFAEGRSRGETEREWGAVPAPTIRSRGPGRPWTSLLAHYDAQGSFLNPSRRRKARPGSKGSGAPRFLRHRGGGAVRRNRSIARPVRLLRKEPRPLKFAPNGAPLPLLG